MGVMEGSRLGTDLILENASTHVEGHSLRELPQSRICKLQVVNFVLYEFSISSGASRSTMIRYARIGMYADLENLIRLLERKLVACFN